MAAASNKYVFDENTLSGYYPTVLSYSGGGTVTVTTDGWVYTDWFFQLSSGAWNVTVNGLVRAIGTDPNYSHLGMALSDVSSLTLSVGAEGEISGLQVGLYGSTSLPSSTYKISNLGTIYGAAAGISLGTGAAITITNGGLIGAASGGVGISLNGAGKHIITNSGEIDGGIDTTTTSSDDTVTNTGAIYLGDIKLGAGNDSFSNKGVALWSVDLGSGINTFTNSGTVGDSSGTKYVTAGIGSTNTYTNTGTITGDISAVKSTNTLKNSGSISGDVGFGAFTDNNITNSGEIGGNISIGSTGSLVLGNTGTIGGYVYADNGYANKITNSGTISEFLVTGTADDIVTNSKLIGGYVTLGDGHNQFTNSGEVDGAVTGGGQVDIVKNTGLINGTVYLNGDNDQLTNSGHIPGQIYLGSGDDVFVGGKYNETVFDEAGKDSYSFGAGNDAFVAITVSGDNQVDTVDGGTDTYNSKTGEGGDLYEAGFAQHSVFINMDSVIHMYLNNSYSAFQAIGSEIGTDNIKNFEVAYGGAGADVIWGGSASESLYGNAGADVLIAGGGNDRLYGGDGSDTLWGGAGADYLDGSDYGSNDGDTDYFYFDKLSDSTVAKAGRDTINHFEDAKDYVYFGPSVGATHLTAGLVNVAFDGTAGAVRVMQTGQGWTIEVDINHDKKADMAIDVLDAAHALVWDGSDFVFG